MKTKQHQAHNIEMISKPFLQPPAFESNASICYHCLVKGKDGVKKMASLSVRKLDDQVYEQLRIRAAKHGVSMEEEARQIISQVVSAPENICDVFKKYFGPENGIDLDIPKHKPHKPMDFDE